MKPLSCLLIEDLEADAQQLMQMLTELPVAVEVDWCQTSSEVLNRMQRSAYDLIFMDIRLPGFLGTDLLRNTPQRPPVIVVTAYIEYAVEGYDLQIADYLHKPYDRPRLQRSINRALNSTGNLTQYQQRPLDSLFLQSNRRMQQFHFSDILYLEASGIYTKVYGPRDVTAVSHSISWLEKQLPNNQFIRVQKSFIVNARHITAVDARSLWINSIRLTVGTQYREPLKQFLMGKNDDTDKPLDSDD